MQNSLVFANKNIASFIQNNSLAVVLIAALFISYSTISFYPVVVIYAGCIVILMLGIYRLNYRPPVLLFFWGTHLLQIFGIVILADYEGHNAEDLFSVNDVAQLLMITLSHFLIMIIVSHLFIKEKQQVGFDSFKRMAKKMNEKKIILAYIISTIIFPIMISGDNAGIINQLMQAFVSVRYAFLILLIFALLLKENSPYKTLIIGILIFEFVLSFVSFFSSFKMVFIIILLTYLTIFPKISFANTLLSLLVIVSIFSFMSFWTNVKTGYREYLNKGTRIQSVQVTKTDALDYISDKAANFTFEQFKDGNFNLLQRIQYMELYAYVVSNVPKNMPFQDGNNLWEAIKFVFVPRVLNKDKGILNPSLKTTKYTRVSYSDISEGTSISMGYFADFYIDFGFLFMVIPLLGIVAIVSLSYNYIINNKKYNLLFNYALIIAIFPSIGAFESDIVFFLGILKNYIVMLIIGNTILFPWLNKQLFSADVE